MSLEGAFNTSDWDTVVSESLAIELNGAGNLNIPVDVGHLQVDVSGVARITLSGTADSIDRNVDGLAVVNTDELVIRN